MSDLEIVEVVLKIVWIIWVFGGLAFLLCKIDKRLDAVEDQLYRIRVKK